MAIHQTEIHTEPKSHQLACVCVPIELVRLNWRIRQQRAENPSVPLSCLTNSSTAGPVCHILSRGSRPLFGPPVCLSHTGRLECSFVHLARLLGAIMVVVVVVPVWPTTTTKPKTKLRAVQMKHNAHESSLFYQAHYPHHRKPHTHTYTDTKRDINYSACLAQ